MTRALISGDSMAPLKYEKRFFALSHAAQIICSESHTAARFGLWVTMMTCLRGETIFECCQTPFLLVQCVRSRRHPGELMDNLLSPLDPGTGSSDEFRAALLDGRDLAFKVDPDGVELPGREAEVL